MVSGRSLCRAGYTHEDSGEICSRAAVAAALVACGVLRRGLRQSDRRGSSRRGERSGERNDRSGENEAHLIRLKVLVGCEAEDGGCGELVCSLSIIPSTLYILSAIQSDHDRTLAELLYTKRAASLPAAQNLANDRLEWRFSMKGFRSAIG